MKKRLLILFTIVCLFLGCLDVKADDSQSIDGGGVSGTVSCDGYKAEDVIVTACGLPEGLVSLMNDGYNLLKIGVPIVLIVMGMIDLAKAIVSQKEDEIKKGWQTVVKRTLVGISVFFVFFLVQLIVDLLPKGDSASNMEKVLNCSKCILLSPDSCEKGCIVIGTPKKTE